MCTVSIGHPSLLPAKQAEESWNPVRSLRVSQTVHQPGITEISSNEPALLGAAVRLALGYLPGIHLEAVGLAVALSAYSRSVCYNYARRLASKGYAGIDSKQSMLLEPSLLTEEVTVMNRIGGPTFTVIAPDDASATALIWSVEAIKAHQVSAAVVAELLGTEDGWVALAFPLARPEMLEGCGLEWDFAEQKTSSGHQRELASTLLGLAKATTLAQPDLQKSIIPAYLGDVAISFTLTAYGSSKDSLT